MIHESLSEDTLINDIREKKTFKSQTFSEYKKTEVCKELLNSINKGHIENALHWSVELICSGFLKELWEVILLAISKHIHLANPKLPIYINKRFNSFKEILVNGYLDNELALRNNMNLRNLFAEIITVVCYSDKKPSIEQIKIDPNDYNIVNVSGKFVAPNVSFAKIVFRQHDAKEIFIPINELIYNLSIQNKNLLKSCYWSEWIIEFDILCRRNKRDLKIERRTFAPVNEKFQMDSVWLIWEALLYFSKKNKVIHTIIESLLELFSLKYSFAMKRKRRYLLYFALELITEHVNTNIHFIKDSKKIKTIVSKINNIYKIVKKNEQAPKTDYLFNTVNKGRSNLEKTIERLETMNKINNNIIPRTNE